MTPSPCLCGADDCERCYPELAWTTSDDDAEPSPYDGCEPEIAYLDEVWP